MFAEIEPHLADGALLGSNTSTLPITGLAEGVSRPADFIGLHFFCPVDKMPLLEIIKGEKTARRDALPRARRRQADQEDADRGQRLARLLHLARDRHVHQRGHRDAHRGRPGAVDRAGLLAGRLPGAGAAALRRAQPQADAQDPQGGARRARPTGGGWDAHPSEAGDRPHARRVRAGPASSRARASTSTRTASARGLWPGLREAFPPVEDPSQISLRDLEERMLFIEAIETRQVPRRGRDRVRRRRQHRLDHGHRLPGLDRRRAAVHQRLRGRPRRLRRPRARAGRARTASASSRRPRWSRRPSAARRTSTRPRFRPSRCCAQLHRPGPGVRSVTRAVLLAHVAAASVGRSHQRCALRHLRARTAASVPSGSVLT